MTGDGKLTKGEAERAAEILLRALIDLSWRAGEKKYFSAAKAAWEKLQAKPGRPTRDKPRDRELAIFAKRLETYHGIKRELALDMAAQLAFDEDPGTTIVESHKHEIRKIKVSKKDAALADIESRAAELIDAIRAADITRAEEK